MISIVIHYPIMVDIPYCSINQFGFSHDYSNWFIHDSGSSWLQVSSNFGCSRINKKWWIAQSGETLQLPTRTILLVLLDLIGVQHGPTWHQNFWVPKAKVSSKLQRSPACDSSRQGCAFPAKSTAGNHHNWLVDRRCHQHASVCPIFQDSKSVVTYKFALRSRTHITPNKCCHPLGRVIITCTNLYTFEETGSRVNPLIGKSHSSNSSRSPC